jgi:hypothetical protein
MKQRPIPNTGAPCSIGRASVGVSLHGTNHLPKRFIHPTHDTHPDRHSPDFRHLPPGRLSQTLPKSHPVNPLLLSKPIAPTIPQRFSSIGF